jgi:transposase-like protein
VEHLVTYLRYPGEIRWLVYTTNLLERFIKEVERRSKVVEVLPGQDA